MPERGPSLINAKPEIARQWHPFKNGSTTASNVTQHSKLKVWWRCLTNAEHEWQQRVDQRVLVIDCPLCLLEANSLLVLFSDIARQWNAKRNGDTRADRIAAKSSKKVWWQCPANPKHEWAATVSNRTNLGHGCPFCTGRRVDGTNSFASKCPDLAEEWHPTRNGRLRPDQFTCGSHQQVWWVCAKTGLHVWQTAIKSRALLGYGCPVCNTGGAVSEATLADTFPEIAVEWHPTKNRHLYPPWQYEQKSDGAAARRPRNRRIRPSDVPPYGSEYVWWQCKRNADHEWKTRIAARTKYGSGCPFCAGKKASKEYNLEKKYSGLAKLWHPTRNLPLKPSDVTPGSGKQVWWRCPKSAEHVWKATVASAVLGRQRGARRCPFCAGRRIASDNSLAAKFPDLVNQWCTKRNLPLLPSEVVAGTDKVVWWRCPVVAQHLFQAPIKSMVAAKKRGSTGCPFCKGRKVSQDNSLAWRYPELLKYWDYSRNTEVSPSALTHGSGRTVWWHCPKSNRHVWQRAVAAMVGYWKRDGAMCPFCYAGAVKARRSSRR
jgi:hypothetical protein